VLLHCAIDEICILSTFVGGACKKRRKRIIISYYDTVQSSCAPCRTRETTALGHCPPVHHTFWNIFWRARWLRGGGNYSSTRVYSPVRVNFSPDIFLLNPVSGLCLYSLGLTPRLVSQNSHHKLDLHNFALVPAIDII